MKYYFPIHLDGDNRGCEGIAKGTAILLGEPKENLIGLCRNIKLDRRLGVDKYVTLQPGFKYNLFERLINKLCEIIHIQSPVKQVDPKSHFVSQFSSGDIMISTGGDMMCYNNNQVITTNDQANNLGCKTVLWGCSMGPENLTHEKEATLRKFSLIYSRETLSYNFFKSIGLKNVVCLPDPAFVLEPEACQLPDCFNGQKVIGLNISNYTVGADNLDTQFGLELKKLLDYIITETAFHILLIPHVLWKNQDDRLLSKVVVDAYKEYSDRFSILDSYNLNYLQIRYVISHCYAFIGGRTHAVVSAYSTCVPTIALGYSIKSKGIAKDLKISDTFVIDTKNCAQDSLLNAFLCLSANHDSLKAQLENIMPRYKKRAFDIKQILMDNSIF